MLVTGASGFIGSHRAQYPTKATPSSLTQVAARLREKKHQRSKLHVMWLGSLERREAIKQMSSQSARPEISRMSCFSREHARLATKGHVELPD